VHAILYFAVCELLLFSESHRDVFADCERVEERGELKDVSDPRAQAIQLASRQFWHLEVVDFDGPESGSSSPTMCLIATDFPVPE